MFGATVAANLLQVTAALFCILIARAQPSPPAEAQPVIVDADVREAVALYRALSYADVVPLLGRALAKPDLAAADRETALAYLGRTYAIFKRGPEAEATFVELLQSKPMFAPSPKESPRIAEAYANAKARLARDAAAREEAARVPAVTPRTASTDLAAQAVATPPASEGHGTRTAMLIGGGVVVAAAIAVLVIWRPWQHDGGEAGPARDAPTLGQWQLE